MTARASQRSRARRRVGDLGQLREHDDPQREPRRTAMDAWWPPGCRLSGMVGQHLLGTARRDEPQHGFLHGRPVGLLETLIEAGQLAQRIIDLVG